MVAHAGSLPKHIVERVSAACVLIQVVKEEKATVGSGFFVGREQVLTNYHVVKAAVEGDAELALVIRGGPQGYRLADATVLSADEELDLALLRSDRKLSKFLRFVSDKSLRVTQPVWVAGFPFGAKPGLEVTLTAGTITSLRRDEAGQLRQVQVDAAINPGNSGGPVVDSKGRVVGVSRAMVNPKVGSGMAVAIPSGVAQNFVKVAGRARRRVASVRVFGRSTRRGLRVLRAEKVEEPWGTSVRLVLRGARDAERASPFLVEITDSRREVLGRDAVLVSDLEPRKEKTFTIRLRRVDFKDVAACRILD